MELTLSDLRDLLAPPAVQMEEATFVGFSSALDELVGCNVFVRTVTHRHAGRLVAVDSQWLTLDDAAWIADDGVLNEVEPWRRIPGRCFVAAGSVIDVCEWTHDLPWSAK